MKVQPCCCVHANHIKAFTVGRRDASAEPHKGFRCCAPARWIKKVHRIKKGHQQSSASGATRHTVGSRHNRLSQMDCKEPIEGMEEGIGEGKGEGIGERIGEIKGREKGME